VEQTEHEFGELMPINGTVETFFGSFDLDHSFPTTETADRIYDLMDHQRAAQLFLWGLPLVGMTRWLTAYEENYEDFATNTLVTVRTFNERRGILTANETTDYFFGFSDTREAAAILEIPAGASLSDLTGGRPGATMVGMIVDMWQESPSDVGIFGPNRGSGGKHVIVGPNTPPEAIPEPDDGVLIHRIGTDRVMYVLRAIGAPAEVEDLTSKLQVYNHGQEPSVHIIDGEDKFTAQYQPRGLAFWEMLHRGINDEVVQERDRHFMYWLHTLGIEKGKPFAPTDRQRRILEDGAKVGEVMAKTLVYNERLDGVLRQNNWRFILGGDWGDGIKHSQRMRDYDIFDPRARYCYEAVTTSPAMTIPRPGTAQGYLGKFEDEDMGRLHGGERYVIRIDGPVPAALFWSVVIYDADTRCVIDNRHGPAGGKATVGSRTPGVRENDDGSYYVLLGPDPSPEGWEANYVQTLPGRGWFPYLRAYGAEAEFFDGSYTYPTVTKVDDFDGLGA
jgi:hypothetical protein